MTWPKPPQEWEMETGTWGTDADREETTVLSGGASLLMLDTAVATTMRSGWIPVETGIRYECWTNVRSDDITAGYTATVQVEEYGADKSTLLGASPYTIVSRVPTAADTWEWMGNDYNPNNSARWMRLLISKTANAHKLYWDRVHFEKTCPTFLAIDTSVQSIPDSTWTTIEWNAGRYGSTWRVGSPSSGQIGTPIGGVYNMGATVSFAAPTAATTFEIRLKQYEGASSIRHYYGTRHINANSVYANIARVSVQANHVLSIGSQAGEYFEVQVYQNSGSAVNTVASVASSTSEYYNHFTAHRVNPI